ncbi:MAG: hypothetical protein JNN01_25305 [Opitutaceae bacterium]|nr:hypothetical protein [Opitutaceae bacterium]
MKQHGFKILVIGILVVLLLLVFRNPSIETTGTKAPPPLVVLPAAALVSREPDSAARTGAGPPVQKQIREQQQSAPESRGSNQRVQGYIGGRADLLGLSFSERTRLADLLSEFVEIRSEIEEPLVRVDKAGVGVVVLSIPAYSSQGSALKRSLDSKIEEQFGVEKGNRIDDYLGGNLDTLFLGYGAMEQSITVSIPSEHPGEVLIAWSATRPRMAGQSVENLAQSYSGTSQLSVAYLGESEFRHLVPALQKHLLKGSSGP